MDVKTGQLRELLPDEALQAGEVEVPAELEQAAAAELAGRRRALIDPYGPGPMSQFLRDKRRGQKNGKERRRRRRKENRRRDRGRR